MKLSDIRNISKDDLLAVMGLQTRSSAFSAVVGSVTLVGIGIIIGAGAALLVAPKTGRELREELGAKVNARARKLGESVQEELNASRET